MSRRWIENLVKMLSDVQNRSLTASGRATSPLFPHSNRKLEVLEQVRETRPKDTAFSCSSKK